jgi:hypothetical protein
LDSGRILVPSDRALQEISQYTILCLLQNGLHDSTLKGESEKMKRFALAIALACVLSGSALAGDVHSTGAPEPGDMGNGGNQGSGGRDDGNQGSGNFASLLNDIILDLVF